MPRPLHNFPLNRAIKAAAMSEKSPIRPPSAKPAPTAKSAAREARLSAALRENLKRRKEATRARVSAEPAPNPGGSEPEPPGD